MASFQVEVTQGARRDIRSLPGNFRQRILRVIQALQNEPRPRHSRKLNLEQAMIPPEFSFEIHRIRLDRWRVVYALENDRSLITILAVRKRPPYDYEDLAELIPAKQRPRRSR
jgi:mRNA interferase RelE/StbE